MTTSITPDAQPILELDTLTYPNTEGFDLTEWLTPDYSGEELDNTDSMLASPTHHALEMQYSGALTQEQLKLHNVPFYRSTSLLQPISLQEESRTDVFETGRQFEPKAVVRASKEELNKLNARDARPQQPMRQLDTTRQASVGMKNANRCQKRSRDLVESTPAHDTQSTVLQVVTHPLSPQVTVSDYEASSSPLRPKLTFSTAETDDVAPNRDLLSPIQFHDSARYRHRARQGLPPAQRPEEYVVSAKELEEHRQLEARNAEVQEWLGNSDSDNETQSEVGLVDAAASFEHVDREEELQKVLEDYESQPKEHVSDSQSLSDTNIAPEDDEPLARQFIRRTPWQDSLHSSEVVNVRSQPSNSNDAIQLFERQAKNFDTASRSATWGTRRRLSDSEIRSIVEGNGVRHLSLSAKSRMRGNSIIARAKELLPRRRSSKGNGARQNAVQKSPIEPSNDKIPVSKAALSPTTPLKRMSSFGRSKPQHMSTGSALVAMAGPLAAIGRGAAMAQGSLQHEMSHSQAGRSRSKSDLPRSPSNTTSDFADPMTSFGEVPVTGLSSLPTEPSLLNIPTQNVMDGTEDDDEEEDEEEDESEMPIDFGVQRIVPTLDGFKDNIRASSRCQLTPGYLIDRIALEQQRRYKKLSENKVRHLRYVSEQRCPNRRHCPELGGSAELLEPRKSARDPEGLGSQFEVVRAGEEECINETDTPPSYLTATFPPGIPIPPVSKLPAKFECPLCFKVKDFRKPSDWSKHVHEDLQPFSCTFSYCPDPKSFKRKADWVRHENERHRHLERWECNVDECGHVCFRKDNFVQHLVREHRMKEPRSRNRSPSGAGTSRQTHGKGHDGAQVLQLVETCRYETSTKPTEEPCRFCGETFSTWKKLSAHMGKHMEHLAIPVLELVREREVYPDTVISPVVEQNTKQCMPLPFGTISSGAQHAVASPYGTSTMPGYPTSSNEHSPANVYIPPHQTPEYAQDLFYGPGSRPHVVYNTSTHPSYHPGHGMQQSPTSIAYSARQGQDPFLQGFQPVAATYPPAHMVRTRSEQHGPVRAYGAEGPMSQGGLHLNTGHAVWNESAAQPHLHQQHYYHGLPEQAPYGVGLPTHGFPGTQSSLPPHGPGMMATSNPMQQGQNLAESIPHNPTNYYNG